MQPKYNNLEEYQEDWYKKYRKFVGLEDVEDEKKSDLA